MRRAGFAIALALLALGGCASVLGLEDRHLEEEAQPTGDDDDGGKTSSSSGASSSSSGSGSSSSGAPAFVACSPAGQILYEMYNPSTDRYRYDTDPQDQAGFQDASPVFRVPQEAGTRTQLLWLVHLSPDDFPSRESDESSGSPIHPIGLTYTTYQDAGDVIVHRFVRNDPLSHRLSTSSEIGGGYVDDAENFYLCPYTP